MSKIENGTIEVVFSGDTSLYVSTESRGRTLPKTLQNVLEKNADLTPAQRLQRFEDHASG